MFFQHSLILYLTEVGVDNSSPVELHSNHSTFRRDLLGIPFSDRLQRASLGGNNVIDRAMVLSGTKLGVLRTAIVEHLYFNPIICGITLHWRADPDAIV